MTTTASNPVEEIRELLQSSVSEVFKTMLSLEARPAEPRDCHGSDEALVAGSVGFVGDVNGVVFIYVTAPFAHTLACRMLGMTEAELEGDDMVNDVIGELSNMIVGAVKSLLCDSGAPCVLTIPSILRGQKLTAQPMRPSERRVLGFQCGSDHFVVELQIKLSK